MPKSFHFSCRLRHALACVPVLLAACGGGGGGGGTPPPTAAALTITSANQETVAADALDSATNISTAQTGTALVTGVQVATAAGAASLQLASAARKLVGMVSGAPATAMGVAINRTLQCTQGGTLTITGSVSGASGVAGGDSVTFVANGCQEMVDNVLTTMNGTLSVSIVAGSYDSSNIVYPAHLVMSLLATNFQIATPSAADLTHGDLRIDLTDTSSTSGSMILSGSSLTNSVTVGASTHASTLLGLQQTITVNGNVVTDDVSAGIDTDNPGLGHVTYQLATTTPLTQTAGAFTGGSLKVMGSHSALLLTATGADAFSLQLDANGDGAYEGAMATTVTELQSKL